MSSPSSNQEYDSEYISNIMNNNDDASQRLILNLTTGEFFTYQNDNQYNIVIKEVLENQIVDHKLLKRNVVDSHWIRTDKIIFVPSHLIYHVKIHYTEISL